MAFLGLAARPACGHKLKIHLAPYPVHSPQDIGLYLQVTFLRLWAKKIVQNLAALHCNRGIMRQPLLATLNLNVTKYMLPWAPFSCGAKILEILMPKPKPNRLQLALIGNSCILLSTIFWGVNYPFTQALIPDWMSAQAVAAARFIGGCALFWLTSMFIKCQKLDRQSMIRAASGGGIGLFGCIYLFIVALKYGSAIDISIIMTMPPIFVILLEVVFAGRRPSWLEYLGVLLSFAGAAMVILERGGAESAAADFLLGDCLAVAASFCFALYLFILAKPTAVYGPVSLLRWVFLFSSVPALFLLPGLLEAPLLHHAALVPWLEIGFIVLCPTFLAYLLTQPAERDIGAVLVALYQYLTPVVVAITAMLMGVDRPRWAQAIAMLIIVAGMLMTNFGKKMEKR